MDQMKTTAKTMDQMKTTDQTMDQMKTTAKTTDTDEHDISDDGPDGDDRRFHLDHTLSSVLIALGGFISSR